MELRGVTGALLFLVGLATGVIGSAIWHDAIELLDIYREDRP